jgi:hypothetical protein
MFLRGKRFLAGRIPRVGIKGQGPRKPDSTETAPDFYRMFSLPPLETTGTNQSVTTHGPISAHLRALLLTRPSTPQTLTSSRRTELATGASPSNAAAAALVAAITQAPSSLFLDEDPPVVNGSSLWRIDATNPCGHETMPAALAVQQPWWLTADEGVLLQVITNQRLADAAIAAANTFWLEQQLHQQVQQQQALLSELYCQYQGGWPAWLDPDIFLDLPSIFTLLTHIHANKQ